MSKFLKEGRKKGMLTYERKSFQKEENVSAKAQRPKYA